MFDNDTWNLGVEDIIWTTYLGMDISQYLSLFHLSNWRSMIYVLLSSTENSGFFGESWEDF